MKRIIAVFLTITVFMLCFNAAAFAKEKTKISDTMRQAMSAASDDAKLEAYIWLYCHIDDDEVFRQAVKECGYIGGLPVNMTLDEVYAYKAAYSRIVSEQEAAVSHNFVGKLGVGEEDIVYLGKHPYVILKLTKAQINEADTFSEVSGIDYANDAPADAPADKPENSKIYEEQVKNIHPFLYGYRELYYHSGGDGAVDWVLITGSTATIVDQALYMVIGNRVVIKPQGTIPFGHGYAVYDVKQNTAKTVSANILSQYDGLEEAFNKYGCGKLIGDLDGNDEISIADATIIQRCQAQMRDYPDSDLIQPYEEVEGALKYYSDFNRDGKRDINDATAIQRFLAGYSYPKS